MKRKSADSLLEALEKDSIAVAIFDRTVPNPTIGNVEEALALYKENNCEGIIAFGGGSSIDCAKCVGARIAKPNKSIPQLRGYFKVRAETPPVYAIPTTAGTGSEATVAAVIDDEATRDKYSITDLSLIPRVAVLDPQLTVSLPKNVTAATGMDALTHAVEAFIGRSNTKETREMAIKAVKLIFENIYTAYTDGTNIEARRNMQLAAYFAGIAFTRAYVGNVHAVAHTLGGLYGTPHGYACALVMPHVLESYGKSAYKPLAELTDAVSLQGDTIQQKVEAFIDAIRDLNSRMEIPDTVDFIIESDIPTMVDRAYHEANPMYPVPRIFSRKDFKEVITKLMSKESK
jgi:alcohol dehydrogenase class IV